MHYQRIRQGKPLGPVDPLHTPSYNGEWFVSDGYVIRWNGQRHESQHRVVMEQILGRELEPWENVHHLNGKRNDNSRENLELWVVPQPAGQRPEDLATWVVKAYPDLVLAAIQSVS